MGSAESKNLDLVRSYLAALESGKIGAALASYFHHDAVQIEYPNRLNPSGGKSDLPTLLARAEQGTKIFKEQHFETRVDGDGRTRKTSRTKLDPE